MHAFLLSSAHYPGSKELRFRQTGSNLERPGHSTDHDRLSTATGRSACFTGLERPLTPAARPEEHGCPFPSKRFCRFCLRVDGHGASKRVLGPLPRVPNTHSWHWQTPERQGSSGSHSGPLLGGARNGAVCRGMGVSAIARYRAGTPSVEAILPGRNRSKPSRNVPKPFRHAAREMTRNGAIRFRAILFLGARFCRFSGVQFGSEPPPCPGGFGFTRRLDTRRNSLHSWLFCTTLAQREGRGISADSAQKRRTLPSRTPSGSPFGRAKTSRFWPGQDGHGAAGWNGNPLLRASALPVLSK